MMKSRSGTVLIVVAGVAALLAMMALTFLTRIRSDVNEMRTVQRETQARLMLNAACMYILEASRIGWDTDITGQVQHLETYGWIDVRDGSLGPRVSTAAIAAGNKPPYQTTPQSGRPVDPDGQGNGNFPIGKPFRFDMHVTKRPPYSILQRAAYNPVSWNAPDNGRSYLRYPDPLPSVDNGSWARSLTVPGGAVTATQGYTDWSRGDPTPIQETANQAWFRLVRENTGAIFTVTCGAGGTLGYKDWPEVVADGLKARELFSDDSSLFASIAGPGWEPLKLSHSSYTHYVVKHLLSMLRQCHSHKSQALQ
jgi:hypothetical protein